MKAFGRFLAQTEPDGTATELLEKLVQRVCEAVVLQDRRDALQQLRDLLVANSKALLAFGAVGVPAMLQVVTDREDVEMVQLALESLAAAVASGGDPASSQAVAINAQQLARSPDALPLLLGLLEGGPAGVPDFYARYHTLQVLKGLAAAAPRQLQEAILGAPLGMTRLMDLLGEQEVLRNEALLLLGHLAAGSADLQQIAAFEGGFDRLFGIIREEGWLDGDIVVQDCLQLLAALLRGSPPNQLMFRDAGFLAQLPSLLRLPDNSNNNTNGGSAHAATDLPPQKAANFVAAMDVVLALLPPPAAPPAAAAPAVCAASHADNRRALMQRGLLDALLALALQRGGAPDDSVRAQALLCLAALVSGSHEQQGQLAAATIYPSSGSAGGGGGGGEGVPLLQAVLHAAVCAPSAPEQVAADRLLEAYCCGNPAGQAALAGSLTHAAAATAAATPASAAAAGSSFGGLLLLHLGRQGNAAELAASSRAAAALSHLVAGSPSTQSQLLTLQLTLQPAAAAQQPQQQQRQQAAAATAAPAGFSSIMVLCASHLGQLVTQQRRQPGSVAAAAALLRLLLLWLHGCPPAVTAFLRAVAQTQPFLVDSVRGSNACSASASSHNLATRGMLALLLGECAAYAEDAAGTPSQQQLLDAIDRQVGQQQFLATLDGLAQHLAAAAGGGGGGGNASSSSSSSSIFGEEPSLSPAFAAFLTSLAAEVRQRVSGTAAPTAVLLSGAQHPASSALHRYVQQQQQQQQQQQAVPVPPPPPPAAAAAASGGRGGPTAPPVLPLGAAYSPAAAAAAGKAPPLLLNPNSPAAAAASPRLRAANSWLPPVPGSPAGSNAQLQEALAAVEALQRDNQQLRAELAAASDRLHRSSGSSATNGHLAANAAGEAAAAAEVEGLRRQLAEAQAAAERALGDLAVAQAAARKLETDLEDLSAAYSTLDSHADTLQQQVDRLQAELAVGNRAAQPPDAQRQRDGGGSLSSVELEQRVEAARQEAEAAAEEAMVDLLVCLGQEEAKVARLRERLEASGVDCDSLLADILAVDGAEDLT